MVLFDGVVKDLQSSHQDRMGFADGGLNNGSIDCSRHCKFCSKDGGYCNIAEAPFEEERKRLIAIRNSLKEVENRIMFLQRVSSWQQMDRNAAFTCLEESRLNLIAKVTEYKGRSLDVVTELNALFGNGNDDAPFNWNLKERLTKKAEPGVQNRRFLITNFISKLLIPWKWQRVGIAVKLVVVSVSISSIMAAFHTRQLLHTSSRKMIPFVVSTEAGKSGGQPTVSKSPLDPICGRG